MPRLTGKVAIVTGSSSGLGRAIALAYADEDAKLIVCADLQPTVLNNEADTPTHELISEKYGAERAVFVKTNITVASEVEACVQEAVQKGGALHIMVNNAGLFQSGVSIHEMSQDTWDRVMTVNGRGTFLGCKYACAQFLRQDCDAEGHRGWIVNVSSTSGLVAMPGAGAYSASKAATISLTKTVAGEYGREKVHCNALCPGLMKTGMTEKLISSQETLKWVNSRTPMFDETKLDLRISEVARGALFLVSNDASFITGVTLPIDGGFSA